MDKEIDKIIDNLENCFGIFDYVITPIESNLLVSYIKALQQQVKKQKEVIDKAREYINKYESIRAYYEYIDEDGYEEYNCDEDFKKELLDILKRYQNENRRLY